MIHAGRKYRLQGMWRDQMQRYFYPDKNHPTSNHHPDMKRLLTALFLLSFVHNGISQSNPDWKANKLKDKVRSVSLLENYRYKREGKFTEWEILYNTKMSFDKSGRYTEYASMTPGGDLSYKTTYAYFAAEKRAVLTYHKKDENPFVTKHWRYNAQGLLSEIQEYNKDNTAGWRYVHTYDEKGNRVTLDSYKPEGTFYSKTSSTFDAKGNETGYLLQTTGYANSSRKYTYDDKGNKTEEIWMNGKNETDFRFVRAYDAYGSMTEESTYKKDKLIGKVTWQYVYDKKGNWIRRTQYSNEGVDFDVAERTIVYY